MKLVAKSGLCVYQTINAKKFPSVLWSFNTTALPSGYLTFDEMKQLRQLLDDTIAATNEYYKQGGK